MTRKRRRLQRGVAGPVIALLALGGCAGQGSVEERNAETVALTFSRSINTAAGAACGLLAPQTLRELEDTEGPCSGALPERLEGESGPAASIELYGKDAVVHLPTDTVFLARFRDGWRVTAAGCTREQAGRPYNCKVKAA